tara:strand:+ start:33 stop:1151 length:1119 start_codon:yes stop_codon:yes gene_type:complete
MGKIYQALGLMSGTSMDGIDASIIQTDGKYQYKAIFDKYFKFPKSIYKNLTVLRKKIKTSKDLKKYHKKLKAVEKEITIFHADSVKNILKKNRISIDFIGFHGQTIFHNAEEKITKQLGDGKLLSKLTRKKVVYNFRKNDLKNGGEGAPLTPIFHYLISNKHKLIPPNIFVNIGGIANFTYIGKSRDVGKNKIKNWYANDLCLGNCLIDQWIREKTNKNFDKDGKIAKSGKINKIRLKKGLQNYKVKKKNSLDIKDFDLTFVNGLSLKDGAATLTEYTAQILSNQLMFHVYHKVKIILCGGGRKNKFLIQKIKKKIPYKVLLIDNYKINGDFVESQAFAYLAVRSVLKLPISFPETTGCKKPSTGGVMVKNF